MSVREGFAVWITGLPASGKSTRTRSLAEMLEKRGIRVVALESDVLRRVLTPEATYSREERNAFYRSLAEIGSLITRSGVPVIFDATASRRAYRDYARSLIPEFIEVYVRCPLAVCMRRDPKKIYSGAAAGAAATVPGVQSPYEPPEHADVILDCEEPAERGAATILDLLQQLRYI